MAPKQEERDFTGYADKEPTGTMEAFADWLIEVTGVTFPTKKAEEQFRKGVQLGGTLRMEFQASDYWRADERNPRSPAGKKARAAANGSAKGTTATQTRGKAKAQVEEDTEDEQDEAPAQPARRGRPKGSTTKTAAAKTTPAKGRGRPAGRPASGRRGSAAAKGNENAEAPY